MTTVNYPNPVMVNGYSCKNCTQVDEAKKHIDPAHPKDGPFGIFANTQPPNPDDPHQTKASAALGQRPAVTFGGVLAGIGAGAVSGASASGGLDTGTSGQGRRLDISV